MSDAPPPFEIGRLAACSDEDADRIDEIARLSAMDHGFSAREEFARPWSRVWVATRTLRPKLRVGRPAPELEAFLVGWHVADELHVLNIATAPASRRRGIGAALMTAAIEYAAREHVHAILLEVRRSNRDAIRLYRRFAFTATRVRARYYADTDEDAIEMQLSLDPATGVAVPAVDEIEVDVGASRG